MEELVQCVPNFSEGRDRATIEAIVAAVRTVPDVRVADWSGDPDHHRMVLTLVGPAAAARDAAFAAAVEAVRRIDLTQHAGEHPRLGAVDVVPFVPLGSTSMELCIRTAREFGARAAAELKLPVYFYEEAATRPERRSLALVRGAGFDALRRVPLTAERAPDLGPLTSTRPPAPSRWARAAVSSPSTSTCAATISRWPAPSPAPCASGTAACAASAPSACDFPLAVTCRSRSTSRSRTEFRCTGCWSWSGRRRAAGM